MSWRSIGKALKRGVKGVAKLAVKAAPIVLGGPVTAGTIGAIAASKLKTAGHNLKVNRLAAKGGLKSAIGRAPAVQQIKDVGRSKTLGELAKSGPKLSPAAKIKITGNALEKLNAVSGTMQNARARASQKSIDDQIAAATKGWTKDDWTDLANQYVADGKPGTWKAYVARRV